MCNFSRSDWLPHAPSIEFGILEERWVCVLYWYSISDLKSWRCDSCFFIHSLFLDTPHSFKPPCMKYIFGLCCITCAQHSYCSHFSHSIVVAAVPAVAPSILSWILDISYLYSLLNLSLKPMFSCLSAYFFVIVREWPWYQLLDYNFLSFIALKVLSFHKGNKAVLQCLVLWSIQ